jgi:hypothetical protein
MKIHFWGISVRLVTVVMLFSTALALLSFSATPSTTASAQTAWTLQWSDDFTGAANTGVNTANWIYDTGKGYGCIGCPTNWGTGEVETMSSSTANVYLDGSGHLAIKPIKARNGTWTSGRIETVRTDFQAPAGGMMAMEAYIQLPNVTDNRRKGIGPHSGHSERPLEAII